MINDFQYIFEAAVLGNAEAQYTLGLMYETGDGVLQDNQKAVNWYTKAAEQGHADAQYALGVRYANGDGVVQDAQQAANWCIKAAEQGHADAQYNLGASYANGDVVVQDDQQTVSKAAEQGEAMYQFTALLNTSKKKEAYLSGNQNCLLSSSKAEMYQVAKSVDGLTPTAPYTEWANNLDSINDFDFHIFQDKDKEKVKLQAQSYAINNGILNIRKGRPTKL